MTKKIISTINVTSGPPEEEIFKALRWRHSEAGISYVPFTLEDGSKIVVNINAIQATKNQDIWYLKLYDESAEKDFQHLEGSYNFSDGHGKFHIFASH